MTAIPSTIPMGEAPDYVSPAVDQAKNKAKDFLWKAGGALIQATVLPTAIAIMGVASAIFTAGAGLFVAGAGMAFNVAFLINAGSFLAISAAPLILTATLYIAPAIAAIAAIALLVALAGAAYYGFKAVYLNQTLPQMPEVEVM